MAEVTHLSPRELPQREVDAHETTNATFQM